MTLTVIRNADRLVCMDATRREIPDAAIAFRKGVIEAVGPTPELAGRIAAADTIIDAQGCVITPGLVNTHHHLFQSLTRAVPDAINTSLFGWLRRLYPIWASYRPEDVFAATQLGLAELALSGCTLSADHLYLFPDGVTLDDTIAAASEIGIRFHPTRGAMSVGESNGGLPPDGLVEDEATIIADTIRVIDRFHDPREGAMIRTGIAHCPCSNRRLGSGIAPLKAMFGKGVPLGFGVDGSASNDSGNLLFEARQALFLQRAIGGALAFDPRDALFLATRSGAAMLGRHDCGSLEPGKRADMAVWDMRTIHSLGAWDPVAALILSPPPGARDVFVEGRAVVRANDLVQVGRREILRAARSLARLKDLL